MDNVDVQLDIIDWEKRGYSHEAHPTISSIAPKLRNAIVSAPRQGASRPFQPVFMSNKPSIDGARPQGPVIENVELTGLTDAAGVALTYSGGNMADPIVVHGADNPVVRNIRSKNGADCGSVSMTWGSENALIEHVYATNSRHHGMIIGGGSFPILVEDASGYLPDEELTFQNGDFVPDAHLTNPNYNIPTAEVHGVYAAKKKIYIREANYRPEIGMLCVGGTSGHSSKVTRIWRTSATLVAVTAVDNCVAGTSNLGNIYTQNADVRLVGCKAGNSDEGLYALTSHVWHGGCDFAGIEVVGRSRVRTGHLSISDDAAPEDHITITSSGRVLIGTDAASLSSSTSDEGVVIAGGQIQGASNSPVMILNALGSQIASFRKDGGSPSGSIMVTATTTSYNTTSDARLKTHLGDVDDALEVIAALQARQFEWNATGDIQTGFFAQDVQRLRPWAVAAPEPIEDEEIPPDGPYLTLNMTALIPDLWAGLQYALAEIETLKNGEKP